MTIAPTSLMRARTLLLEKLGPYGLKPLSVGIVGSEAHKRAGTSYHLGRPDLIMSKNPYSVVESGRDRNGLSNEAAALDVGEFSYRDSSGRLHNLQTFSIWCVTQCQANAPDTRDIREIIYSPDGVRVLRYDRLGVRSTGDNSHLTHTHFSFFRDATGRDLSALFVRYLTTIGLMGEDLMFVREGEEGQGVRYLQHRLLRLGHSVGAAGVDGRYGAGTKAAVRAAELAFNPNFKGDGSIALSETWTRLDEMYVRQEAQKLIQAALKGAPTPVIDYTQLGQQVDASRIPVDYARLEGVLEYRKVAGEVLRQVAQ